MVRSSKGAEVGAPETIVDHMAWPVPYFAKVDTKLNRFGATFGVFPLQIHQHETRRWIAFAPVSSPSRLVLEQFKAFQVPLLAPGFSSERLCLQLLVP